MDSFRTELIRDRVFKARSQLELAIVEYVAWFNDARLHESLGDLPPSEYETLSSSSTVDLSLSWFLDLEMRVVVTVGCGSRVSARLRWIGRRLVSAG